MAKEKLYGGLIIFFMFPILFYMTVANANIILSNGIPSAYPYLGELFFNPWVYVVVPIMLVEFIILGILIWIGWNKMNPPKPIPLKEHKFQELEKDT
ncbi:MAG: hypothetical protein HWN67_11140 [Candidatus Helarchaeota archaeon]|nr:hypothetical protein [Candidatus Helarchaeota archaeon]